MSTFNIIKKISYEKNKDVVELKEYTMFFDEASDRKCLLFKFYNTVNRPLKSFRFEITEFDQQGNTLAKSILEHKGFNVTGNDYFIPKAKYKVNPKCEDISIRLLYASYDYVYWEHDQFNQIPCSIDAYSKDTEAKAKKQSKQSVDKGRNTFKIKSILNQNRSKLSKALAWTFGLLCLAAVITCAIVFQIFDKRVMYKGIEYERIDAQTLRAVGYNEKELDGLCVDIPSSVGIYRVVEVAHDAFTNTEIEQVIIHNKDLIIKESAFANCQNLKSIDLDVQEIGINAFEGCIQLEEVNSEAIMNVRSGAFKDCLEISTVYLPFAQIDALAFQNDLGIQSFTFGDTSSNFVDMFSLRLDEDFSIRQVATNMRYIYSGFFNQVSQIENLQLLNSDVHIDFGALNNVKVVNANLESTDTMVVSMGKIVSVNQEADSLVIPKSLVDDRGNEVSSFQAFLDSYGLQFKSLEILGSNVKLDSALLNSLPNVKKISLAREAQYDASALFQMTRLESLSIAYNADLIAQEDTQLTGLRELNFIDGYEIPAVFTLEHFPALEKVTFSNSFIRIGSTIFQNCENLREITMPSMENFKISELNNLRSIEITYAADSVFSMSFTQLPNLTSLILPSGILVIQSEMISACSSLSELVIPDSCATMENSMIGSGMSSLKKVTLPTLNALQYKSINQSYIYTEELTIKYACEFDSKTLRSCSGLRRLIAPNATLSVLSLKDCTSLEYLDYYASVLISELFDTAGGVIPLKNVHVRLLSLNENTFLNCQMLQTIIIDYVRAEIGQNIFSPCVSLRGLYLGGANAVREEILNDLNSTAFTSDVNVVFDAALNEYQFTNQRIFAQDMIYYTSYCYIFVYNSREIYVSTLFIIDLRFTELAGINTSKLKAYQDEEGIEEISLPYFAQKNTRIYLF